MQGLHLQRIHTSPAFLHHSHNSITVTRNENIRRWSILFRLQYDVCCSEEVRLAHKVLWCRLDVGRGRWQSPSQQTVRDQNLIGIDVSRRRELDWPKTTSEDSYVMRVSSVTKQNQLARQIASCCITLFILLKHKTCVVVAY